MEGQITLADYQQSISYTRSGETRETPSWVKDDRCKDCIYWELDPVSDQPPEGWGVYGQCSFLHEGQLGYQHTDQWSYCQDWRSKWT